MNEVTREPSTFESIFFANGDAVPVRVPDYQRAYSWEQKQVDLFIADLKKYHGKTGYYFGHFILEVDQEQWEVVDGQQRLTTLVLFLMVCRVLSPSEPHVSAYSMTQRFSTVSYDVEALGSISRNLGAFLKDNGNFDAKKPPSDEQIIEGLALTGSFTRSQRRIVLALLRFHQAFQKGELERDKIAGYIEVVMKALSSCHLTRDKSVAVSIFEMHNTRGIPLSTIEIIKAKLMKFVYDHGGTDRETKVRNIQAEFGEIYGMEERLAARSFRGEMSMEHILRLHLRVVDDGTKERADQFDSPAMNASADGLIAYVDARLNSVDGEKVTAAGIQYAMGLAKEFKKSVRLVSETLPAWDNEDPLVGDVLILDRELSCQFFLIVCRRLERRENQADGRIASEVLLLWERLLFTRDFHGMYYGLRSWGRDNFPALFESCGTDETQICDVIQGYLTNGFRPDRTTGLQSIVLAFLNENKESILTQAFYWWKPKMIYALYKYDVSKGAKIREVMKTISVEHMLPQEWEWDWVKNEDGTPKEMSEDERDSFRKEIDGCINGIGNLLLITPGENSSVGNGHPADKRYDRYCDGGSYEEHHRNREKWRASKGWANLIQVRGEEIFSFMVGTLCDTAATSPDSSPH